MLTKLLQAAQTEVENHSIYVWGGSGQLCKDVTESWIRARERGRMPDEAVKAWADVEAGPFRDVARLGAHGCVDCLYRFQRIALCARLAYAIYSFCGLWCDSAYLVRHCATLGSQDAIGVPPRTTYH